MKTIFTCIVNDYDDLKEPINSPPHAHQHWKFVCYTDNPNIKVISPMNEVVTNTIWEIRPLLYKNENPAKSARWHKINFHEHVDTEDSMFIDGTFFINVDLNRWWRRFKPPFTTILHPFDDCAYTDIRSCIGGKKGNWKTLMRQANDYMNEGLPENYGLISSGILMRRKTKEVIDFCKLWWEQVEKYTERDQPCFTYTQWKKPGITDAIRWDYTSQFEFIHVPHSHKLEKRMHRFQSIKHGLKSA